MSDARCVKCWPSKLRRACGTAVSPMDDALLIIMSLLIEVSSWRNHYIYLPSHCQMNKLEEWLVLYVPSDSSLSWRDLSDYCHILLAYCKNMFPWKSIATSQNEHCGLCRCGDGYSAVFFATTSQLWFSQFVLHHVSSKCQTWPIIIIHKLTENHELNTTSLCKLVIRFVFQASICLHIIS